MFSSPNNAKITKLYSTRSDVFYMEFVKSDLNPALKYVKVGNGKHAKIDFYWTLLAICNKK